MRVRIGVDTGGTFTDVVALDERTGAVVTTKTPSTPDDPARGFLDGITKVLAAVGADAAAAPTGPAVSAVSHGTTVATNQLLEGRVGDLGFITTTGYEFMLEIARQSVPDGYGNSYFWVKPPRIVPVHRVRTVGGRLDHTGAELAPFDTAEAVAAARWFRDRGITTIGVCFLHAYADPAHEIAMRDVLAREHPGAVVSISSDVLREYREYERSVTTLVDAAVKPTMNRYIAAIADRLAAVGDPPFYVMKSNGGVLSAEEVARQPITTVLSGPAAGALGAATLARTAGTGDTGGYRSVLTLDGGGTSTDVAVVIDGEPTLTTEGTVGGYPSKIPMIDVVTVGAGGGSVAWVSPEGALKVGPRSAGADPGPLCYGRGGAEPTVTDAHVTLGRIPPALLGGEIALDADAAGRGIAKLAGDLGLAPRRCAAGILEISAWNQANAIRRITVRRGLDVRDYPMVAYGGSGPLLACRLMDLLGLPAVIVPDSPGTVSAYGLLTVDVRNDYVRTAVMPDDRLDLPEVARVYADLEARAAAALDREGFARADHRYTRFADLRYAGQAYEVRVPAPDGPIDAGFRARVVRDFHAAHERLYGYSYAGSSAGTGRVEWVNLRLTGIGPIARPRAAPHPHGDGDPARARSGTREVDFADGPADTPLYARRLLAPGDVLRGPAVIEEYGSTVPLHPGYRAAVDGHRNLVITEAPDGR